MDKLPKDKTCGSNCRFNCFDCSDFYMADPPTNGIFEQRKPSWINVKSSVFEHAITHSQSIDYSGVCNLGREDRDLHHKVKEAIWMGQE